MNRLSKEREAVYRLLAWTALDSGDARDVWDELDAVRAERDALLEAAKSVVGRINMWSPTLAAVLREAIRAAEEKP